MEDGIRNLENITTIAETYNLKIRGIVHVGAHFGQEIPDYINLGVKKIVCFEPLQNVFEYLNSNFESRGVKSFRCALGDKEEIVEMNVPSDFTMSSSILKPKLHLIHHAGAVFNSKETVQVKKLTSFESEINECNFLIIDVQGYEYQVLKGAENLLNQFDYIYTEVNRDETYENNKLVNEIDELLAQFNFKRVETWWAAETWGDALYLKK